MLMWIINLSFYILLYRFYKYYVIFAVSFHVKPIRLVSLKI